MMLDSPPREIDRKTSRALKREQGALVRIGMCLAIVSGVVTVITCIAASQEPEVPYWVAVIQIPGILLGIVLAILGYRKYFAARRVYEMGVEVEGLLVIGQVSLFWQIAGRGHFPVRLEYVFEDENGKEHAGRITTWHRENHDFMLGKVGTKCTILYDREDPSNSLLYDSLKLWMKEE